MSFDVNGSVVLEPRLSFSYQLPANQSVSLSYGLHSQVQPLPVYFQTVEELTGERDPGNRDLGFTRAHHIIAGFERRFLPDWRVKVELYYQYLFDVPVERNPSGFSMLNAGADFGFPDKVGLVHKGTGVNKGMEWTIEKFLSRGAYVLFTTSLFDSRYKGSDGVERNTAFNYKYVVNILAGREWRLGGSGANAFTFDTRLSTIGGRYATPIDVAASLRAGGEVLDSLHYNSQRLDGYFRLDTKFGIQINSRKNIFLMQYNHEKGTAGPVYQIGFFPDILYRVQL